MPHALVVDDDADARELLARLVAAEGYSVAQADSLRTARARIALTTPDVLLLDLVLPDGSGIDLIRDPGRTPTTDVVLMTGQASLDSAIEGLRLGAVDYLVKPVNPDRVVQLLRRRPKTIDLKQEVVELRDELRRAGRFGHLLGSSAPMQDLYDRIARVAPTSAAVLIVGERGSGKELVARTVQALSRRRRAPYLVFDCSALPVQATDAELFGRERPGSSERHVGLLERANGGTLLLSRVNALPLTVQVKLAHFLDDGAFVPALGVSRRSADVRILAATEVRPADAVAHGRFREDLLQRLEVFPLLVPPLRSRGGDVRILAQHFLEEINEAEGTRKRFSAAALTRLAEHSWPGNVRELRSFVQRAYLQAASVIDSEAAASARAAAADTDELITLRIGTPLEEVERRVTLATLARCGGVKKRAAEVLGISLKTLYNRLEAYSGVAEAPPEDTGQ